MRDQLGFIGASENRKIQEQLARNELMVEYKLTRKKN